MSIFRRKKGKKRLERIKNRDSNPKLVLIRQIFGGILLFVCVALIVTGIWHGSRIEKLQIVSVDVIGGETIQHDVLRAIVVEELEGTYYKLIPRRFAWLYPKEQMIERIEAVDRLKHVHIERTNGATLAVVFEEYVPFALWCATPESKECFFMDREGFAYALAPTLQGGAFIRFSENSREPTRFETGFDGSYIRETEAFIVEAYDQMGMNITHVERTGEDELIYHIAGGGKLKVSRRMTTSETLENLTTLLTSEAFSHIEPGNFQYIDLRYGNKIFVNEEASFSGDGVDGATSTPTTTQQ